MTTPDQVRKLYQQRVGEFQRRIGAIEDRCVWITRFRGVAFFPAVILAVCGWMSTGSSWPWYVCAAIFLLAFLVLAALHEKLLQEAAEIEQRRRMNQMQLDRCQR